MTTGFNSNTYTSFLSILGKDLNTQTSITREQLLGGLAYYLTELPPTYVRAFVTIILSSPALWASSPRSCPFEKLHPTAWGVMQAAQQAVHAKHAALLVDPSTSSILPPVGRYRVLAAFREWIDSVVSGSHFRAGSGGSSIPRLALLSGLVLGLHQLRDKDVQVPQDSLYRSYTELVISVAECLDQYAVSVPTDAWDTQHALQVRKAEPHLDTIVELCSVSLPLVPDAQLEALGPSKLACICLGAILHIFQHGHCFDLLQSELLVSESGALDFKDRSRLVQNLKDTHSSSIYIRLGPIANLTGHIFVCMAQSKFWRPKLYLVLSTYIDGFCEASSNLERSWTQSALCMVDRDESVAPNARPTTTIAWHILKSFLFSTVLVAQSILDTVIYYPAITSQQSKILSRGILTTLCRLSFISSSFGALTAEGGGFKEMKRAFFGALDVLASNADDWDSTGDQSCLDLVVDLASELSAIESSVGASHPIYQGRVVYFLVCAEHVINQLPEKVIEQVVLPIVQRELFDNINREKYEAAHSVMLAIFAAHNSDPDTTGKGSSPNRTHILIPAYISVLLQNSEQEKLSTDQLCLAFQVLVQSAASADQELSWYCVGELLAMIDRLLNHSGHQDAGDVNNVLQPTSLGEQILRLQLALIASISAVPWSKLAPLLESIREQLDRSEGSRDTLANAAYREIMERLGDQEKDFALRWWTDVQSALNNTD